MLEIWEGLRCKADKDNDGQVRKHSTKKQVEVKKK